jgi:SAM-dependent methyltransferase
VDYRQAPGEDIPFEDDFFDLVICQNLLDHVASYDVVLDEVTRVLREPNLAYFGTDVYSQASAEARWARQARGEVFDIQHPHTFTVETLEETLENHGFQIVERLPTQPSGKGDDSTRHCLFAILPG